MTGTVSTVTAERLTETCAARPSRVQVPCRPRGRSPARRPGGSSQPAAALAARRRQVRRAAQSALYFCERGDWPGAACC